jgi:hypothetical protein
MPKAEMIPHCGITTGNWRGIIFEKKIAVFLFYSPNVIFFSGKAWLMWKLGIFLAGAVCFQ